MFRLSPKARFSARIGVVVLFTAIGFALSQFVARIVLAHEGRVGLQRYSNRLLHTSHKMEQHAVDTITAVNSGTLPVCSIDDLARMRDMVFQSHSIRDIGRLRGNLLICNTEIGRLATPKVVGAPDITLGTMQVTTKAPMTLDHQHSSAFIAMDHDVSVAMDPNAFFEMDEPPMTFSGFVYDPVSRKLIPGFGHASPLTQQQILDGKPLYWDGMYYQPQCLAEAYTCVVAMETESAMLATNTSLKLATVCGVTMFGAAFGLILVQAYRRSVSMETQLRRAIRKGLLEVEYQPIVELDSGKIIGAEALVRWTDELGVKVRPDIFVALAEECGFVTALTRCVTSIVTRELGELLTSGEVRVTINIASTDLADEGFSTHLHDCLDNAHAMPGSLGLELTERMTANHESLVRSLARFKLAGHTIYIDDFGTGYSSLAYLHKLDVDFIKIDRSFTRTIGTEAVTASVVPQILDIAKQLNLKVVVEGIETEEQAAYFRSSKRGILGQGWLFGKPMTATALRKAIRYDKLTRSAAQVTPAMV